MSMCLNNVPECFQYLRWSSKWRHKFAMASLGKSSVVAGRDSTSTPLLKYSSFRKWNNESTLVAAKVISLMLNRAGLGSKWIRYNTTFRNWMVKRIKRVHTGWESNNPASNSGWGNATWLLVRSRTLGTRRTMLLRDAVRKAHRGSMNCALKRVVKGMSISPNLILGWAASTKGPT